MAERLNDVRDPGFDIGSTPGGWRACEHHRIIQRRPSQGNGAVLRWAAIAGLAFAALVLLLAPLSAESGFVKSHPRAPAKVWAVGDGGDGSAAAIAVAEMIGQRDPDRFLYLGDVYPSGSTEDFDEGYRPVYGRFDRIAAPTPGNHEWGRRDDGYYPYWAAAKRRPTPDWYAFRVAGWQILSLNSEAEHGPGSAQVKWLRSRLRASARRGTCRIAFWHRPRYSAGRNGENEDIAPLWRVLAGKARIVVNGHDHDMQRHRRRDGIVGFVSGAGGHELRNLNESDPILAFSAEQVTGALRLVLRPRKARASFLDAEGSVLDSKRLRCRPGSRDRGPG